MNPSSSEMPGLQLPQPVEQAGLASEAGGAVIPEAGLAAAPERASNPAGINNAAQAVADVPLPLPPAPHAGTPTGTTPVPSVATPQVADDTDLIEKEWVAKAKQIVAQTREDPFQQSKDLTVFKADYMQKRYNKTIKLGE